MNYEHFLDWRPFHVYEEGRVRIDLRRKWQCKGSEGNSKELFWDTIRMSLRGERVKIRMDWLDSINFQDA